MTKSSYESKKYMWDVHLHNGNIETKISLRPKIMMIRKHPMFSKDDGKFNIKSFKNVTIKRLERLKKDQELGMYYAILPKMDILFKLIHSTLRRRKSTYCHFEPFEPYNTKRLLFSNHYHCPWLPGDCRHLVSPERQGLEFMARKLLPKKTVKKIEDLSKSMGCSSWMDAIKIILNGETQFIRMEDLEFKTYTSREAYLFNLANNIALNYASKLIMYDTASTDFAAGARIKAIKLLYSQDLHYSYLKECGNIEELTLPIFPSALPILPSLVHVGSPYVTFANEELTHYLIFLKDGRQSYRDWPLRGYRTGKLTDMIDRFEYICQLSEDILDKL